MTARVKLKSLTSCLMLVFSSTAMLMVGIKQLSAATPTVESTGTTNKVKPETKLPAFLEPKLPPLGEPSLYLPQEKPSSETIATKIRLVIKLSDRRVYLYRHNKLLTSYPIAIGKAGWETPKGNHVVIDMQRYPVWEHPWTGKIIPPGKDNPLGARWIGFWTDGKNFIGFHGTPNEELVGQAVSHGCIRMKNKDVISLFAQVDMGTPVTVEP